MPRQNNDSRPDLIWVECTYCKIPNAVQSHHRRTGNQGMRLYMDTIATVEEGTGTAGTVGTERMAQRWQIARGGNLISLTHRPPPPIYICPLLRQLSGNYHQLYTILETTPHYLVKYPLAILSDHPFDVSFPISLAKCRFTTFVLSCLHLGSLTRMLNGTCCSRLPSRKMLLNKSFRSEPSLFYPSGDFANTSLTRAKDQAKSQGGSIRHEYSLIKGFT